MSFAVVWIDLEHAKVFHFSGDQMKREEVRASYVDHHTHKFENDERDSQPMYEETAQLLSSDKRILILGPGLARSHFLNYLKEKHEKTAQCVQACEPSDHPTDSQIAAKALEFFGAQAKRNG